MVNGIDDSKPVEIADKIWWVGFADYEAGFSNNPYLMLDEGEGILFDPGPGHPIFRDMIMGKIRQIINPEKIKYIIVHHQDPDLCGLIPFIENILHPDVTILCHPRAALFIPYYGTRKGIMSICDEDILELKSGRRIQFFHIPYMHFPGNMFSYDIATSTLFSSDIFGCFNQNWRLYSDDSYIEPARKFIEYYVGNRSSLLYAYDRLKSLNIDRICPQHGAIIKDDIDKFVNLLITTKPGGLLRELKHKPGPEQLKEIVDVVRDKLSELLHKDIQADSLNKLMEIAGEEGSDMVSLLIDAVVVKSALMGVTNPLTCGQVHKAENVRQSNGAKLLDALHQRYLRRQYGIMSDTGSLKAILGQGLNSFETNAVVMFIDIRGFTKWSSDKHPDEIMSLLSVQHGFVAKIINSNGGRVNKIFGDGMLAYFKDDYIDQSIRIANEIHRELDTYQLLPVGIGMDYGKITMGDMGQEDRLDYTLIGSPVNLASRLCDCAGRRETVINMSLFEKLNDDLKKIIDSLDSRRKIKVQGKSSEPEFDAIKFGACDPDNVDISPFNYTI
jgi:class 3 adenylate cyclase